MDPSQWPQAKRSQIRCIQDNGPKPNGPKPNSLKPDAPRSNGHKPNGPKPMDLCPMDPSQIHPIHNAPKANVSHVPMHRRTCHLNPVYYATKLSHLATNAHVHVQSGLMSHSLRGILFASTKPAIIRLPTERATRKTSKQKSNLPESYTAQDIASGMYAPRHSWRPALRCSWCSALRCSWHLALQHKRCSLRPPVSTVRTLRRCTRHLPGS